MRIVPALSIVVAAAATPPSAAAQNPPSVYLEELTWTEVRDALAAGHTTVIVPTAGTEQNGPHMVLGKHRYIVDEAAGRIARELGNALVAPSLTYVPEGDLDPPSGHMRYPGTITLSNEVFMQVVESAARSFAVHGFTDVILIGDSGGNQRGLEAVAERLNAEWAGGPTRVHFVGEYYSDDAYRDWVLAQGHDADQIGSHAGILDTSLLLAVAPAHIRRDRLAPGGGFEGSGVRGDPTLATAEIGRRGMELRVEAGLRQIRRLLAAR